MNSIMHIQRWPVRRLSHIGYDVTEAGLSHCMVVGRKAPPAILNKQCKVMEGENSIIVL